MDDTRPRPAYEPSRGAAHALAGLVLLVIGGLLLINVDEDPEIFMTGAVLFLGSGSYQLIVGAVARGIQVARAG